MSPSPLSASSVPDRSSRHISLWNTEGFYDLNPDAIGRRVQIDHHAPDGRLIGSFVAARVDDRLVSGFSAPFGGVDFVRADEVPKQVVDLARAVFERASAEGVARIEIRMKPAHHGPAEPHLLFALLTVGAVVELADLNFFLDVGDPAVGQPGGWLQPRAKKAARRAADLGWRVELLDPADEDRWAGAYTVLERNRAEKGRPMRLSLDYVRRLRDRFGPLIRMHVVRDDEGSTIAAALLYRTTEGHDVVQYWGDAPAEHPVSPMPLLAHGVFIAAREAGARYVDLGISTDDGQPNHGLIQFKRSVGARTEVRLELAADVASVLGSPRWERLHG